MSSRNVDPDLLRLKDIIQAVADIEEVELKPGAPRRDLLAIAYSIAVIGEAASRLSSPLKEKHSNIPWRAIVSMRHKIVHEYGKLDPALVLTVVHDDIPNLKHQVQEIIITLQKDL